MGSVSAQHDHLIAGAQGTTQDDKLIWVNEAQFAVESGYVSKLIYTNGGPYSNTYNREMSFVALARTAPNGGPVTNAAALGAILRGEIVSVNGPAGGVFSFWETNSTTRVAAFSIPVGMTNTSLMFDLTASEKWEGASPMADPFGHIHGRRFSVNKPGLYTVSLRLIDGSTNGIDGNPIHRPSDLLSVNFEAVLSVGSILRTGTVNRVSFKAEPGMRYDLMETDNLGSNANWRWSGTGSWGTNAYINVDVPILSSGSRFYRLRAAPETGGIP